jgi:hypothetical protein
MATIFKSLAPSDYSITPFPTYYEYTYNYTSGSGGNSPDVQVLFGSRYPLPSYTRNTPNPQYDLYDSIVQIFYSSSAYASYGIKSDSYIPSESVYVVSIAQNLYGNKILPTSFAVVINGTSSYDDGTGNLIASSSNAGDNIGFVFYDKGIAVIKPNALTSTSITKEGIHLSDGGTVEINFTSTMMVYEHSVRLKIEPKDFLHAPNNPTVTLPINESTRAIDAMYANTMKPYQTALGLYNENNELLAVAKLSNPIQRTADMPQTFIVKFDT